METVVNGLKTFLKGRSYNSDLNQQKFFNVKLSARIKIPCDILTRMIESDDWLQEMQFLDVSFQEEGMETDLPATNVLSKLNVAFKQSDGSQRCMEFQNGTQSKNIIIKRSVEDFLASEEVQQSVDENSLEVLSRDAQSDPKLSFNKELPEDQISKIPETGIYVDMDTVKEECELETNINMHTDKLNSLISESYENAKIDAKDSSNDTSVNDASNDISLNSAKDNNDTSPNDVKDSSNDTLLDEDDVDSYSSINENGVKDVESDESWNPDGKNGTKMIRKKAKSPRGKRKTVPKPDSETKIKKKRMRERTSIEKCEELENLNLKSKKRRSSRKKSKVPDKEDSEFEEQDQNSETKKATVKNKRWNHKVSCEYCNQQFDQIRAFNIHVDTHKNILETQNSADVKEDSVMRLNATEIEILEAEMEDEKEYNKDNQSEVLEIKLSEESGLKVNQEEICGVEELKNSEILKKQDVSETSNSKTESNFIVNCSAPKSNVSQKDVKKDYDVLSCCYCEKKFGTIAPYNKHIKSHSFERPFVCDQCQGSYKTKEHLKIHKFNVHHKKRFSCESCDRSYKYKISLERHFTSNHKLVKPHICHICGKDYYSKSSLIDHISRHSKEKPFKCDVCNQHYHSKKLLSQHTLLHFALLKHQCDQCGKSFKNNGKLTRHLEQHASQRNYVCEICQMAFTLKRYYVRHKVTHDPLRTVYKCDACFKQFANKTNLTRHKLTFHSDAKPFQCDVCNKAFKLKSLLDQHARVHKEEKDYICKFCKKKFSFNSSLHSHVKNHHKDEVITESKTPEANFKCKICENLFYSKSALTSHYKFHQA